MYIYDWEKFIIMINNSKMKAFGMPMVFSAAILLSLSATGCGGGGGAAVTAVPPAVVAGAAVKGPYVIGSAVQVFQINLTTGARILPAVGTGAVTDIYGNYSVNIPAGTAGPFEIAVTGSYLDETTGLVSANTAPTSMIVADLATATAGKVQMNPVTSVQTALVKASIAAAGAAGGATTAAQAAASISTSGSLALQKFGINTQDAAGVAIDPAKIDIFAAGGDPTVKAQFVAAAAIVADLNNNAAVSNAAGAIGADAYLQALVSDIQTGTTAATTAAGVTAAVITAAKANTANAVANLDTAILAADAANQAAGGAAAAIVAVPVAQAAVTTQAAAAPNPTVITGFGLTGNQFTVGTMPNGVATYTVAANGVATQAVPVVVGLNDVIIRLPIVDTGVFVGARANDVLNTTFNFDIKDANGPRSITGSVGPVKVFNDPAIGGLTINVIPNAVLKFDGVDATGVVVNGPAAGITNVGNNLFINGVNGLSIDANNLLGLIQAKFPAGAAVNVLGTAGTFNMKFSTGIDIGTTNAANAMTSLYPIGIAGGRQVSATITTQ